MARENGRHNKTRAASYTLNKSKRQMWRTIKRAEPTYAQAYKLWSVVAETHIYTIYMRAIGTAESWTPPMHVTHCHQYGRAP